MRAIAFLGMVLWGIFVIWLVGKIISGWVFPDLAYTTADHSVPAASYLAKSVRDHWPDFGSGIPARTYQPQQVVQVQPVAAPPVLPSGAPQAQPAGVRCSTVNPSGFIGGSWTYWGTRGGNPNEWRGSGNLRGVQGWVVHTPGFPGDPGLPVGQTETTSVATAYNVQGCMRG